MICALFDALCSSKVSYIADLFVKEHSALRMTRSVVFPATCKYAPCATVN